MTKRDIVEFFRGKESTEVECTECGHDWTPKDSDTHPSLCHVCGYDTANGEYDVDSFMDFWANFNGQK